MIWFIVWCAYMRVYILTILSDIFLEWKFNTYTHKEQRTADGKTLNAFHLAQRGCISLYLSFLWNEINKKAKNNNNHHHKMSKKCGSVVRRTVIHRWRLPPVFCSTAPCCVCDTLTPFGLAHSDKKWKLPLSEIIDTLKSQRQIATFSQSPECRSSYIRFVAQNCVHNFDGNAIIIIISVHANVAKRMIP